MIHYCPRCLEEWDCTCGKNCGYPEELNHVPDCERGQQLQDMMEETPIGAD